MRALIFGLSVLAVLAIIASANTARAGLSTTPREVASVDPASLPDEANQQTEDQLGLTKATRREVQRGLAKLGFGTRVNGKFDKPTRAAITRWQDEHGYPKTGFLDTTQHTALLDESSAAIEAGKSDHQEHHRGGGRTRHARGIGGPIGAIGGAIGGLLGR
ncbi:peptidoglycan-binding domain-containing protein [Bradyrhizobium sp.]|jgi:peptidoglycan hydrolase-like protein with peptidoglycan-binding domain|uniref:peptidoglycan-binding domain-containing protein n=1 Tax=Bradyrhizobium sp. TaxID=376 RepID=UPI003BB1B3C3